MLTSWLAAEVMLRLAQHSSATVRHVTDSCSENSSSVPLYRYLAAILSVNLRHQYHHPSYQFE